MITFEEYQGVKNWIVTKKRFGNNELTILKAKLNAAFQLTVRGIPFIYYGEEIGMTQVFVLHFVLNFRIAIFQ